MINCLFRICWLSWVIFLHKIVGVDIRLYNSLATLSKEHIPWNNVTIQRLHRDITIASQELSYLMTISIGNPKQKFLVLLDTGSCDFWVPDEYCSDDICLYKAKYDIHKSEKGEGPLEPFTLDYLDSFIEGFLYQDQVSIGSLHIPEQIFGSVERMGGPSFEGDNFDGILGLCPSKKGKYQKTTVIQNLMDLEQIKDPVFSLWLAHSLGDGGILSLGEIKDSLALERLIWFKTVNPKRWATLVTGFRFGKSEIPIKGVNVAVLDSGTSFMSIPERFAKRINRALGAVYSSRDHMFEVACDEIVHFPNIRISLDKHEFILTPDDYISVFDFGCFSNIEGRNVFAGPHQDREVWILGGTFLRAHFTAYNVEKGTFAIAPSLRKAGKEILKCKVI